MSSGSARRKNDSCLCQAPFFDLVVLRARAAGQVVKVHVL